MKIGHTIDENGYFTGDVVSGSGIVPDVKVICPNGFYKPKWNGTAWVEGLTQEEIDAIVNAPVPKTPDQFRIEELEAQLSVMNTNNIEFMEMILQTLGVE